MRKTLAVTAVFLATVTACADAEKGKYSVTGTVPASARQAYVIDKLTGMGIDTVAVVDGRFAFEGIAAENALLAVATDNGDWQTLFFNDGVPVVINLNDSTLRGSALNEKLTKYDIETSNALTALSAMSRQFMTLSEAEQKAKMAEFSASYEKKIGDINALYDKILSENRDNVIPAAFIDVILQLKSPEEVQKEMDPKYVYANHPYAQSQKKRYDAYIAQQTQAEAAKTAFIGQQFTDLEEADVDGKMHKLSEYVGKGQWVLVDFWASWCGPCRAEMSNVVAAYEKYHAKGFDIVGLSFDNKKEPWVKAIADLQMPWVHLSDLKGWKTVASATYNVNSIPDNLLVDPSGKIVARGLRGEALGAKLREIYGE